MLQVNLKNAAKASSNITLDVPLSDLVRLKETLDQHIFTAAQSLEEELKELNLPSDPRFYGELQFNECPGTPLVLITGSLTGQVPLRCQTCLKLFIFQLKVDVKLAFITKESQLPLVPDDFEPFLHPRPEATYAELLEDDLLLGVPPFPRHAHDQCELVTAELTAKPLVEKKKYPFAELKSLLQAQEVDTE